MLTSSAGAILWSKDFTTLAHGSNVLQRIVKHTFLEERTASSRADIDGSTVRWIMSNELELTFLAIHQRILQLTYVDALLQSVKERFTARFKDVLKTLPSFSAPRETLSSFASSFASWDAEFLQLVRQHESNNAKMKRDRLAGVLPSETPQKDVSDVSGSATSPTTVTLENSTSERSKTEPLKGTKAAMSAGGRRVVSGKMKKSKGATVAQADPVPEPQAKKSVPGKTQRKWDTSKAAVSQGEIASLDFSQDTSQSKVDLSPWIDETKLGTKRSDGIYELAEDDLAETSTSGPGLFAMLGSGRASSLLSRLTGAKSSLGKQDLDPILQAMQTHLQSKNVASDVAALICEGVEKRLIGKKIGNFGSVKAEVRASLNDSITRILTPSTSTDILLDIASKKQRRSELLATLPAHAVRGNVSPSLNPYSIGFVGVNGVGKSTNLAKVCFWLLQNRYRVLIAACDTFRSGAVEQLRTHVRNLGELEVDGHRVADGAPGTGAAMLELYERGYGKDAAGIAKDALAYARNEGFDVVLIDTAGRMQDNEPLMRALAKLIAVNQPDKVLFVGEALVGNEAVDQLTKFNRALKDYSGMSSPRGLDGCLLTKWDTVDVRTYEGNQMRWRIYYSHIHSRTRSAQPSHRHGQQACRYFSLAQVRHIQICANCAWRTSSMPCCVSRDYTWMCLVGCRDMEARETSGGAPEHVHDDVSFFFIFLDLS